MSNWRTAIQQYIGEYSLTNAKLVRKVVKIHFFLQALFCAAVSTALYVLPFQKPISMVINFEYVHVCVCVCAEHTVLDLDTVWREVVSILIKFPI